MSLRSLAAAESGEASQKDKPKHEERERFSVAAIAFCLEHDKGFKRHFLDVIGKLSHDRIGNVILEPEHYADLVLEGEGHVFVLEFKLGALLQDDQNPEDPIAFEKGYGAKIQKRFSQSGTGAKVLRYVVIGKEFDPCIRQGLHCSSVPWRKLLIKDRRESKLEKDLYDCLGHLGAPVFLHRHMKKHNLAREARQGMAVYGFLEQVLSQAGLLPGGLDGNEKALGLNIKRTGEGSLHRKLIEAVQPKGQKLGWIGYSAWDTDFVHPAVGLYCSTKEAEAKLHKRLAAVKVLGEVVNDGLHIYVDRKHEGSTDDAEWFMKVLKTAAGS